ncbi:DinB family protein [Streptomyces sp. NPDC056634]|uniref:DinB family protein n=1 Tax=Streptomyces sp. NPDC056634 TaxID=3345885 RepID=UPI0036A20390
MTTDVLLERMTMHPTSTMTEEAVALQHFLDAQRASARAILDGLTDEQLRTSVLPSGWTPLGLIKHLGDAERHWFQEVFRGTAVDVPWPDGEEEMASGRPVAEVFAFYREQCERGNALLATTPLDAKPAGRHGSDLDDEVADLRRIVLHMIEETARHLGHLDAARELLDGRTGLGPR